MTPTEIEKLKERTKDRAQYLGNGTGCSHLSCGKLFSLIAALEAAEGDIAKLADPNAVHVNLLRGSIAKPSLSQIKHVYPEIEEALSAKDAEIERLTEYINEVAGNVERAYRAYQTEIEAAKAALKEARTYINGASPDWHYSKQEMLAKIDEVLQ